MSQLDTFNHNKSPSTIESRYTQRYLQKPHVVKYQPAIDRGLKQLGIHFPKNDPEKLVSEVKRLQEIVGTYVDGMYGPKTHRAFMHYLGIFKSRKKLTQFKAALPKRQKRQTHAPQRKTQTQPQKRMQQQRNIDRFDPRSVAFVGDSIMVGTTKQGRRMTPDLPDFQRLGHAVVGRKLAPYKNHSSILGQVTRVIQQQRPSHLVVNGGINDLYHVRREHPSEIADDVISSFQKIMKTANQHGVKIILMTIIPPTESFYHRLRQQVRAGRRSERSLQYFLRRKAATMQAIRRINQWIRKQSGAAAVVNAGHIVSHRPYTRSRDGIHLTRKGYRAIYQSLLNRFA